MSKIHAEIDLEKHPHINKGLEGIVAFTTAKSLIDGQKGELIYAGYNIDELAENATFEEVCFISKRYIKKTGFKIEKHLIECL